MPLDYECETCSGEMTAEEMEFVSKEEILESASDWEYESGGWVCVDCGYPVTTEQLEAADPEDPRELN